MQLRALDWDTSGPLQNAPAVVVYHPEDGNAFANVGWAGWIATITGKRCCYLSLHLGTLSIGLCISDLCHLPFV